MKVVRLFSVVCFVVGSLIATAQVAKPVQFKEEAFDFAAEERNRLRTASKSVRRLGNGGNILNFECV